MPETNFRPSVTGLDDRAAPSALWSWSATWSQSWSWAGQQTAAVQTAAPAPAAVYTPPAAQLAPAPAAAPAPVVAPALPSLNAGVIAYCQANMGQTVDAADGGDCYDLAASALKSAGAKPQWQIGTEGPNASHYAWGTPVFQQSQTGGYGSFGSLGDVKAGDILQMDGYREVAPNGFWADAPHHTAVVTSVDQANGIVNVVQQNWNGQHTAQPGSFNVSHMTSGVITMYRPVAN